METPKIAYLISQYPAVSHTFILREAHRLRALGMVVETASINLPDRLTGALDVDEAEEMDRTFYIKEQGIIKAGLSLMKVMLSSPSKFLKGISAAVSLAGWDLGRLWKHAAYLGEASLLGEWMLGEGLHHVHVHFANPAATVALIATTLFPVTFSLTVHGPDEFYDVTLNNLSRKFEGSLFVICISDYAQSQVMKLTPILEWYKFHVMRLGVDTEVFSPRFEPVRGGTCRILCIGRLVPSKGQQTLIAAFERLVRNGKDVHLRFIGGGPDRADLENEVRRRNLQKKVHFSGPLNPKQVMEAYKEADVFALPSFAEGLPVVLMEAMAMGIPCVATCVDGVPELIRHNVEGLLVPPSNIAQLSQTLELLADDPELRSRLGAAGRLRVLERYNLDANVESLYFLLRQLIS